MQRRGGKGGRGGEEEKGREGEGGKGSVRVRRESLSVQELEQDMHDICQDN